MFSNNLTRIIVSLLLVFFVFSAATDAATTTTYSGVTTTYVGNIRGGVTAAYSGINSSGSAQPGENVTDTVKTPIPVATVTEKASQTETGKIPTTPSEKASGFEVVFGMLAISILWFKLKRR